MLEAQPAFVCFDYPPSSGYRWWTGALRPLIEAVGHDTVAEKVAVIEFFPYRSVTFRRLPLPVPSQRFGFQLARDAVIAGKLVVVL
jgi:hypothetical protein